MVKKCSVWLAIISIIMLASCSTANLIDGVAYDNDEIKEVSDIQQNEYIDLTIKLPDTGRGWTVARYSVTASKSGETDVTETTTTNSLSMRLRVGDWSFVASGYDSDNNLIYLSSSRTATVSESSSTINLLLDQQSGAMKGTFTSDNGVLATANRIVMTAVPSVSGFDTITSEVTSFDQTVYLKGLLAGASYNITAQAFIGDIKYAEVAIGNKTAAVSTITEVASSKKITQIKVTPVSFSHPSGSTFSTSSKVTLSCATGSVRYYYTLDGTTPTTDSQYTTGTTGITIDSSWSAGKTIKVIAGPTSGSKTPSEVAEATYYYNAGMANTPSFSIMGGTYNSDISVTLTNNESSGTVKYSYDGSSWNTYSTPIAISGNGTTKTIYAKVVGVTDKDDSAVLSQTYTISYSQLGEIAITPNAGTYFTTQQFTMSAPLDGATIYYTTNNTTPTTSSTQYTGPFTLPAGTHTIKAICVKAGYENSAVTSLGTFNIINDSSVTITTAGNMIIDGTVWITNGNVALSSGANYFVASGLTASTTYEIKWMPASLTPTITITKDGLNTAVSATAGSGKYTFNTGSGVTSSTKFYINFNVGSAVSKALIGLGENNTVKPVTAVAISPSTVSGLRPGDTQAFSVTYTPSGANMGKDVNWSVSNSTVLGLAGSTITVKKAGSSNVTAALDVDSSISSSVAVSIGANVTVSVTVLDWVWNDSAVIKAWVWGDTDEGSWKSVTKTNATTASITFATDTTGFLLARCAVGTTTPNWSVTSGDGAGRIYNQTENVTFIWGTTSYDTTDLWKGYGVSTKTITVNNLPDWWFSGVVVYASAWDVNRVAEWYPVENTNATTGVVTIPNDKVGMLFVRCPVGTTEPDWDIHSGDGAGRIYNKTADIDFTDATEYTTSTYDYP